MSDLVVDTTELNRQQQIPLAWTGQLFADDITFPDAAAVSVLLVDDDKVDRMVVRRSFSALNITNPIIEADDGIKALDLLRGHNGCEKLRQPYIVLLDLHMPRMNGIEFLDEVLADPTLPPMLIFVLTTSPMDERWMRPYASRIAGFVSKNSPEQSVLMAISMATSGFPSIRHRN